MNTSQMIGQILGIIAVILGFVSYQAKNDKQFIFVQGMVGILFTFHYYLLGATPGAVLNAVGVFRNIVYYHKDKKFYNPKFVPALFAVIMLILGIYSANGIHSVLVIGGLVIYTVCSSFKNVQNVRKSVLISCPMVLIYDIIEHSVGGTIYESVSIVSAIIGIIRYRRSGE